MIVTKQSALIGSSVKDGRLALSTIMISGGTQSREKINQSVVKEYAESVVAGVQFPPVIVFYNGERYWLADGYHRFHAHKTAGKNRIAVDVRQGTQRDAILYSVGANESHGLRRTNEDKRRAVLTLTSDPEWSKWSDREIARRCAVSNQFVSNLRPSVNDGQIERIVQRGDATFAMKTAGIGKTPSDEGEQAANLPVGPAQAEAESARETARAALPQAIKDLEQAKADRRLKLAQPILYNGLTADQRVAELEETVSELEKENASLKAEVAKFGSMRVQFEQGGFEKVIADKDDVIRAQETRVYGESRDKASWMKSAKYWQAEAKKLGWSGDVIIDIETGEVVDG